MAAASKKLTKAEIQEIARTLACGQCKAVGHGIQLRRDKHGRLRYQLRIRMGGRGSRHLGGTYETWTEADRERRRLQALKENGNRPAPPAQRAGTPFEKFAQQWWDDHVLLHCDALTQLDYGSFLERDILPYWTGYTLGSITRQHGRDYQRWLMTEKIHHHGARKGQMAISAIDRAMSIFNRVLNYAVDEGVLELNPCRGIKALGSSGAHRTPRVKEVDRRDIFIPTEIELRLSGRGRGPLPLQQLARPQLVCGPAPGWHLRRERRHQGQAGRPERRGRTRPVHDAAYLRDAHAVRLQAERRPLHKQGDRSPARQLGRDGGRRLRARHGRRQRDRRQDDRAGDPRGAQEGAVN